MSNGFPVNSSKQDGIAVLVLVIFISMAAIAYFLAEFSTEEIKHQQVVSTSKALSLAKEALIAYAVSRADINSPSVQPGRLGYLPCPANNNGEGNSVGSCGAKNQAALGWFPWRSLGLPPLMDESGTCLLYAVSGPYKFNPPADMLNEDAYGMFQVVDESSNVVQGSTHDQRIVAVVFAAGKALPGQSRTYKDGTLCGDDVDNFEAYLDSFKTINNSDVGTVSDQIDQFIHATVESRADDADNPLNDRFITITRNEIWAEIMLREELDATVANGKSKVRRVTEALARCLAQYGNDNVNSHLPFPAPVDLGGNDYRSSANYDDAQVTSVQHFGRFPYIVDDADANIPGTIDLSKPLFDKDFKDPPDYSNPPFQPHMVIKGCNDLPVLFPAGLNADLRTAGSEDRVIWENRKDHYFYAVSNSYRPSGFPTVDTGNVLPVPPGQPRCGNCIQINGIQYAAVVIYSGKKIKDYPVAGTDQTREAPIAATDTIETKNNIINYIEEKDISALNTLNNGQGIYEKHVNSNDVMFCITDTEPLDVVPCP